jgi:hypothetical protein
VGLRMALLAVLAVVAVAAVCALASGRARFSGGRAASAAAVAREGDPA